MGWARYLFLGDLGQQFDLNDQKAEIRNLRGELRNNRVSSNDANDISQLKADNAELRLYLTAVVRLLTSKGIVTQDELKQIVDVVDAEDGIQDGRISGTVVNCQSCGHAVNSLKSTCLYCGSAISKANIVQ